jgi:hypothetical protein
MAERIIYRGRPRANKPYPFQVDVDALPETYFTGLLGPLTLDELMEIKFRVKKFKVTCSVVRDGPANQDTETISFEYELERGRLLLIIGPKNKSEAYTKESEFTNDFIVREISLFEHLFIKIRTEPEFSPLPQLDISRQFFESIFKTNAGYYLPFSLNIFNEDVTQSYVSIQNTNHGDTEGNLFYFNCQLKIRSKTHSIRCYTIANSASLTIEATEWWPYANADGQPIWNTADGTRTSNPFT